MADALWRLEGAAAVGRRYPGCNHSRWRTTVTTTDNGLPFGVAGRDPVSSPDTKFFCWAVPRPQVRGGHCRL